MHRLLFPSQGFRLPALTAMFLIAASVAYAEEEIAVRSIVKSHIVILESTLVVGDRFPIPQPPKPDKKPDLRDATIIADSSGKTVICFDCTSKQILEYQNTSKTEGGASINVKISNIEWGEKVAKWLIKRALEVIFDVKNSKTPILGKLNSNLGAELIKVTADGVANPLEKGTDYTDRLRDVVEANKDANGHQTIKAMNQNTKTEEAQ